MTNPLPEFYALLASAADASSAVDNFDLHSENAASLDEWRRLEAANDAAQRKLIDYVESNRLALAGAFGRESSEEPADGPG